MYHNFLYHCSTATVVTLPVGKSGRGTSEKAPALLQIIETTGPGASPGCLGGQESGRKIESKECNNQYGA